MTPLDADETRGEEPNITPTSSPDMQHLSPTSSSGDLHATFPSDEYIDMGRLSRVPSYNTANSSNILNLDPITNALPTYANATSSTQLPVIPEQSRSRSSSMSRASRSTEDLQVAPLALTSMNGRNHVYGSAQNVDDRPFRMMRHLFSGS